LATRSVAATVMMHADDKGLVLPPRVAPVHVVIVPIIFQKTKEDIAGAAERVRDVLNQYVVVLDDREEYTAGWKFNHWELKGVPIRIEIGPRDVKAHQVIMVRRDTGEKWAVPVEKVHQEVTKTLDAIQKNLFDRAKTFLVENTVNAETYEDLQRFIEEKKMVRAEWCGSDACEATIKEETGASSCCIPFDENPTGKCIFCGEDAKFVVLFARHY
jgi:prolyl-tRNA synthetase